jgi:hypothetical protein
MRNQRDALPFSLIDVFVISNSSSLFPLIRGRLSLVHFSSFHRRCFVPEKESSWVSASASCLEPGVEGLTEVEGLCCFLIIKIIAVPKLPF